MPAEPVAAAAPKRAETGAALCLPFPDVRENTGNIFCGSTRAALQLLCEEVMPRFFGPSLAQSYFP